MLGVRAVSIEGANRRGTHRGVEARAEFDAAACARDQRSDYRADAAAEVEVLREYAILIETSRSKAASRDHAGNHVKVGGDRLNRSDLHCQSAGDGGHRHGRRKRTNALVALVNGALDELAADTVGADGCGAAIHLKLLVEAGVIGALVDRNLIHQAAVDIDSCMGDAVSGDLTDYVPGRRYGLRLGHAKDVDLNIGEVSAERVPLRGRRPRSAVAGDFGGIGMAAASRARPAKDVDSALRRGAKPA